MVAKLASNMLNNKVRIPWMFPSGVSHLPRFVDTGKISDLLKINIRELLVNQNF